MEVTVVTDIPFVRSPCGGVWTDGPFHREFWQRYLTVFRRVHLVCRVAERPQTPAGWLRVDGPEVAIVGLPRFRGTSGFTLAFPRYAAGLLQGLAPRAAVILRVPAIHSVLTVSVLQARAQPFGVEVVGDPFEVFATGGVRHPLRPLLRRYFTWALRRDCKRAIAAAYVSPTILPRRYPVGPGAFVTDYSSIELTDDAFVLGPRSFQDASGARLVTVGSLSQRYKGTDVLIDAVAAGVARGLDLKLTVVGDGRHREELVARAKARGIADRTTFVGRLAGPAAVRAALDEADLFVLPSRTEGLPRAAIEAMARGLPCIGSHVGGFPDLLPAQDLVPPGDSDALARRIEGVVRNPTELVAMSKRNLERARAYHNAELSKRRTAFYTEVMCRTETWLRDQRR